MNTPSETRAGKLPTVYTIPHLISRMVKSSHWPISVTYNGDGKAVVECGRWGSGEGWIRYTETFPESELPESQVAVLYGEALAASEPDMRDAYEGAREDLLDWKGRAQRAEARLRSLGWTGIDASEPVEAVEAVFTVEDACDLDNIADHLSDIERGVWKAKDWDVSDQYVNANIGHAKRAAAWALPAIDRIRGKLQDVISGHTTHPAPEQPGKGEAPDRLSYLRNERALDIAQERAATPQPSDPAEGEKWSRETMRMINELTPDVKGKAFDVDWFLLRQRLESVDAALSTPPTAAVSVTSVCGTPIREIVKRLTAMRASTSGLSLDELITLELAEAALTAALDPQVER